MSRTVIRRAGILAVAFALSAAGDARAQTAGDSNAPTPSTPPGPTIAAEKEARGAGPGDAPKKDADKSALKTFMFPGLIFQNDYQHSFGPGVNDYQRFNGTGMDNGFRMTRFGIRAGGRVASKFIFHVMAIVGRSGADGQQRPANNPTVEDFWVGYEFDRLLRVRTGQFQVPYTLDANEFYPPNADFLEPTLMTRFVTAPEIRPLGAMLWGDNEYFLWHLGYINSAGKVTLSGTGDLVGRVAVRPFGSGPNFVQLGIGGRYGARDPSNHWYDAPALLNSTFQYGFWNPVYVTDLANEFHIIPSNQQRTGAAEVLGAIDRVELAAEASLVHQERREARRAFLYETVRSGTLSGLTYYASIGAWVYGPIRRPASSRGIPYVPPPDPPKGPLEDIPKAPVSVQVVTRWEQLFLDYDSIARSPEVPRGGLDLETTRIRTDAFQAIVNVFMFRHVRLSLEFSHYITPGVPPRLLTDCSAVSCPGVPGEGRNQAISPGAVQRGNITATTQEGDFKAPAPGAQTMSQIITRFQLGF
jgi:hypothetical protein